jgi:uncharacterized protein with GYD domain
MATFISLVSFTEKGVAAIKNTLKRADEFAKAAKKAGVAIKDIYWTIGAYDGVLILDAPSEETAASLLVALGAKGFVRTLTMRAFTRQEIGSIVAG